MRRRAAISVPRFALLLLLCTAAASALTAQAQEKEEAAATPAADAAAAEAARAARQQQALDEKFLHLERKLADQNELGLRRLEHVEERLEASQHHLDRLVLVFALSILVVFLLINNNLRTRLKSAEMRVRRASEDAQTLMRDIERELSRPEVHHLHISQILRRLMRQLREKHNTALADAHIAEVRQASNDPYLPVSLYLVARVLVAEHDGDWNVAVQMLEQLREMDGKDADVLLHLSHVHKHIAALSANVKVRELHERLCYQYYGQFTAVMKAERAILEDGDAPPPPPSLPEKQPQAAAAPAPDTPPPAPAAAAAAVTAAPAITAPSPAAAQATPPTAAAQPAATVQPTTTTPPAPPPAPAPTPQPAPTAQPAPTPPPAPTPATPPPATATPPAAPALTPPAVAAAAVSADQPARNWKLKWGKKKQPVAATEKESVSATPIAPVTPPPAAPPDNKDGKETRQPDKPGKKVSTLPIVAVKPTARALAVRLRELPLPRLNAAQAWQSFTTAARGAAAALSRLLKQADDTPLPFLPVPATSAVPKVGEQNELAMWQEIRRGDLTMAKATEVGTLRERNRLIDSAGVYYAQAQAHSTNAILYHNWGIALLAKALHVPEKKRAPFYNAAVDKFLAGNVIAPHYFDFHLASLYAIIGNKAECHRWLHTAREHGGLDAEALRQAPDFDAVRQEPWFKEFI